LLLLALPAPLQMRLHFLLLLLHLLLLLLWFVCCSCCCCCCLIYCWQRNARQQLPGSCSICYACLQQAEFRSCCSSTKSLLVLLLLLLLLAVHLPVVLRLFDV
jgi:hypothetical protein